MQIQKLKYSIRFLLLFVYSTFQVALLGSNPYLSFQPDRSFSNLAIQTKDTIPPKSVEANEKREVFPTYVGVRPDKRAIFISTKYTPRIIKMNENIYFNKNQINDNSSKEWSHGDLHIKRPYIISLERISYKYDYSIWQRGTHLIFDIHDGYFIHHFANSVWYDKYPNGSPTGSPNGTITCVDCFIYKNLDSSQLNKTLHSKKSSFLYRNGYLTRVFIDRQNRDSLAMPIPKFTVDSMNIDQLLKESWYDFHIDKKGKSHAFVYMRGELIYLLQKKASQDPGVNTWKEIFSIPASDDIGPFTSVTVKGKQYLFTQNGTILKNTGKSMKQVGKLPADLRNCSVVWDKGKDKIWYITKEEFDAYKAGDAEIISKLNKIKVTGKSSKSD